MLFINTAISFYDEDADGLAFGNRNQYIKCLVLLEL